MAAPGGTNCPTTGLQMLGSSNPKEHSQEVLVELKKLKRMLSNRESARRSRMRKQKQLDDLVAQVNQLRQENNQILSNINASTQLYLNIETENTILRVQVAELIHRLNSLNEIIDFVSPSNNQDVESAPRFQHTSNQMLSDVCFGDPPSSLYLMNQPTMPPPYIVNY